MPNLHLGCLDRPVDGWVNTDITPHIFVARIPLAARILRRLGAMILLVTRVPCVERGPGFVAIQREAGTELLHQALPAPELVEVVCRTGLAVMRELEIGEPLYVRGAPAPCAMRGWIFRRTGDGSPT
jgi:hypothetical protein